MLETHSGNTSKAFSLMFRQQYTSRTKKCVQSACYIALITFLGIVCATPAHGRSIVIHDQIGGVEQTNQYAVKSLVPVIIEGIPEKYGNFGVQNGSVFLRKPHLFITEGDGYSARKGGLRYEKSGGGFVPKIPVYVGPNEVQLQGVICRVGDIKRNFQNVDLIASQMLFPVSNLRPLSGTLFLNIDLLLNIFVLPKDEKEPNQSTADPKDCRTQIKPIERVVSGVICLFF
jgi:hypothetical protein